LQFEKRRSETEKSEEAEGFEKICSGLGCRGRLGGRVGGGW